MRTGAIAALAPLALVSLVTVSAALPRGIISDQDYDAGPSSYSRVRGAIEVYSCSAFANYTIIDTDDIIIYAHAVFKVSDEAGVHYWKKLYGYLDDWRKTISWQTCQFTASAYATRWTYDGPIDSKATISLSG